MFKISVCERQPAVVPPEDFWKYVTFILRLISVNIDF